MQAEMIGAKHVNSYSNDMRLACPKLYVYTCNTTAEIPAADTEWAVSNEDM